MTLNELIAVLQDHAYGEHGDSEVRMMSADIGKQIQLTTIQLTTIQVVQSTSVGVGIIGEVQNYMQLVFRTEPR
jgi:hypothetical protein